jgi:enediyne polyketide synthase
VDWFAGYLSTTLLLGDPGVRDALMHGNQVCVPDATLLPTGIDRLYPAGERLSGTEELRCCASERGRDGDTYTYDIALRTADGEVVERWEGLRLRAVRRTGGHGPWVAPLLGPYLERALGDLGAAPVAVAVEPDRVDVTGGEEDYLALCRARTALAAGRAFGHPVTLRYRPDGRPEVRDGYTVSAAHGAGLTLCAVAPGAVGCDLEAVQQRPEDVWRDLLGPHARLADLVATVTGEGPDTAATRVWTAIECLRKAGRSAAAPLALLPADRDAWTVFSSGDVRIGVLATAVHGVAAPVVAAVLTEHRR